jgi:predicted tellurium resistance membrane protein TerC
MVFSFDSIITAIGLANHIEVMMIAVIIAMIIMFLFSRLGIKFHRRSIKLTLLSSARFRRS